jgi:hypothetical protein
MFDCFPFSFARVRFCSPFGWEAKPIVFASLHKFAWAKFRNASLRKARAIRAESLPNRWFQVSAVFHLYPVLPIKMFSVVYQKFSNKCRSKGKLSLHSIKHHAMKTDGGGYSSTIPALHGCEAGCALQPVCTCCKARPAPYRESKSWLLDRFAYGNICSDGWEWTLPLPSASWWGASYRRSDERAKPWNLLTKRYFLPPPQIVCFTSPVALP